MCVCVFLCVYMSVWQSVVVVVDVAAALPALSLSHAARAALRLTSMDLFACLLAHLLPVGTPFDRSFAGCATG